ncbi:MAG: hypothetical protein RR101_07890 [Burkholderiaceae bacterium]
MNLFSRNTAAAGAVVVLAACAPAASIDAPASPVPAVGACSPVLLESLKGMTLEAANAQLDQAGMRHRVVSDGDKNFPVTLDFDHQRVGLEIKDGVVTAASCG